MTKVSLRAYNREIEGLIEQGHRLDEAVAHCRHILSTYPKHLDTYRLLGKANLEAKRYDQAIDIFQRVLVATPEDFVSHVGMSIIADDQGRLDEAILHMERAFEVQPSNAAIQAELQRLFGRRDGVEPPKIRLTRGALAHMYVQGELYTQAISEIHAVLSHDQNRPDMQVLLARAYFRNGQKAEAAEICAALLANSPYCLEANRLMAASAAGGQLTDAAREYHRRVSELDPYAEFAQDSVFNTDTVPDGAVTLQRLDYSGQPSEAVVALGTERETNWGAADVSASPPSWLTSDSDAAPAEQSAQAASDDVPDFIREAGWREVEVRRAELADQAGSGEDSGPAARAGDLPEWVKALAPTDESEQESPERTSGWQSAAWESETESAVAALSVGAGAAGESDPSADWLKDLAPMTEAVGDAVPQGVDEPRREEAAQIHDVGGRAKPAAEQDDALAWLEGLAEQHGAKPEELITPAGARPSSPPEWVENTKNVGGEAPEGWLPISEAAEPVGEDATEEPFPKPVGRDDKSLDWLTGLTDQNTFAEIEGQTESEDAPIVDERRVGTQPAPGRGPSSGQAPEWLTPSQEQEGSAEPTITRETSGEYESAVDLPEWLAGLDAQQPSRPADALQGSQSENLPEWLQAASPTRQERDGSKTRAGQEANAVDATENAAAVSGGALASEPVAQPQPTYQTPLPGPLPAKTRPEVVLSNLVVASLSGAQLELGRGNIAAALDLYGRLIRRGRSLDEIIRDLRDALYRYPVEVPIWQALGDAYIRANRLQEALDAYTKAEELLR